jgi:3-oxoacyl-[acyl-carrier-protein] synthase II
MPREIVITGLGTVTALGIGVPALWEGLCAGRSGLARITRFDPSGFECRLGGEVKDLSARDYVPKSYRKAVKVMARDIELAVAAAKLAVEDAKLVTRGTVDAAEGAAIATTYPGERFGCHIGAGLIAAETEELTMAMATSLASADSPDAKQLMERRRGFDLRKWGAGDGGGGGMMNLQPLWMLKYLPNMLACHVTIIHGAEGPSNTLTCGESSGLLCIGESARVIERGAADLCFSGGAESKVNLMGMIRVQFAGRLAMTGDAASASECLEPYGASSGGVLAEAGGIIILEEAAGARQRGTKIYARLAGFGAAQTPAPSIPPLALGRLSGEGLELAIRAALKDAKASPDSIDAILPQGSGVPMVDQAEVAALKTVFGARLAKIPLVTITPQIGDSYAGNGGVQTAVACMCLKEQRLPARLGPAQVEGLDAGARPSVAASLKRVLICTGGMGGQNAAIVLEAA